MGIHHPSGDIMKVSRDDDSPLKGSINFNGDPTTQVWAISGSGYGNGNGWDVGVTEGGSSGSALFDQNGRIFGQLAGGSAACSGTNDNGGYDVYGRFGVSWDDNNFGQWLDPADTGLTTLNMYSQVLSTSEEGLSDLLEVFPNPTSDYVNLKTRVDYKQIVIYGLDGQKVLDFGKMTAGVRRLDVSGLLAGTYILVLSDTNTSVSLKLVVK